MTQSSLIARLRKVEAELEAGLVIFVSDETGLPMAPKWHARTEAALADLRDLIREAEGQMTINGWDGEQLYTALGEKP